MKVHGVFEEAITVTPSPNPLTWVDEPVAVNGTAISITASTASDISGVEYRFECVLDNCNDSDWQSSPSYTDTGLLPGTEYSYRGQARDLSGNQNATGFTSTLAAMTLSCVSETVHVEEIDATVIGIGQGRKRGRTSITIRDNCGAVVNEASVTGTFSGDFIESKSAVSSGSGIAIIETEESKKGKIAFDFCVDSIESVLPYDSGLNAVTCASN